jgi:hypothetical protein
VSVIMLSCVLSSSVSFAGGNGPGGNPSENVKAYLKNLVENNQFNLKASMKNYLLSMKEEKVPLSSTFGQEILRNRAKLFNEIDQSMFVIKSGSTEGYCVGTSRDLSSATTDFDHPGAMVYFDLDQLFAELKDKSPEVQMVEVAALSFHELYHHLQKAPQKIGSSCNEELLQREQEARGIAAYVRANVSQAPFMQWSPPKNANQCGVYVEWSNGRLQTITWEREKAMDELKSKGYVFVNSKEEASILLNDSLKAACTFFFKLPPPDNCSWATGYIVLKDLITGERVVFDGYSEAHLKIFDGAMIYASPRRAFKEALDKIPYCKSK